MDVKRRTFLKYAGLTGLGSVVMSSSSALYATTIEPGWLDVVTVPIHLARVDPAFHGYRIVQLSDIHADSTWMDAQRLSHIVQVANAQNPDLVVITGDFVTYIHDRMKDTLSTLNALRARDGIFAVMGNHDYWSDAKSVRTLLHSYGIQELKDRVHTLYRGKAMLHLVGMDDLWEQTAHYHVSINVQKDVLTSLLKPLPEEGAAILLVHEPDFADIAATTGRIDLQLSGHTHGGQVRLPGYGALRLPRLGKKYQAGLYHIDSMLHYTNRGLGMMDLQVRLNCRPEITTFVL
jgi:predicted MPP superfamily phosphohydrolase